MHPFHPRDGHLHAAAFKRRSVCIRPLPGARELLAYLTYSEIPWAIATRGRMETARPVLESLELDLAQVPLGTRHPVGYARPDPAVFLAAAARLGVGVQ